MTEREKMRNDDLAIVPCLILLGIAMINKGNTVDLVFGIILTGFGSLWLLLRLITYEKVGGE